jgi:acetolactate decarboxylase
MGLKELEDHLDTLIPTRNMLYAVMVAGTFGRVRVRSVPRQAKPYPPLAEAVKAQREFEFNSVRGTVVGFRYPCYAAGINMPGYHFHFLTQDRSAGGHLLDCRLEKGTLMIDVTPRLLIVLPRGSGFSSADMEGDRSGDVEKAEKQ